MRIFILHIFLVFLSNVCAAQSAVDQPVHDPMTVYYIDIEESEHGVLQATYRIEYAEGDEIGLRTRSQDTFLMTLLQDLYASPPDRNDLLIFIHGMWGSRKWLFRNTVDELMDAYVRPEDSQIKRIISVKWPGNDWSYWKNRTEAERSGATLAHVLSRMIRMMQISDFVNYRTDGEIHLMCHSMGNYLFEQLVTSLDEQQFSYPLIHELVLAAPDLDSYALERGMALENVHRLCRRAHVYFHRRDLTLKISQDLNDRNRLGLTGASTLTAGSPNVFFVDASDVQDDIHFSARLSKHFYYRTSPTATLDMRRVFAGRSLDNFPDRRRTDRSDVFLLASPKIEN